MSRWRWTYKDHGNPPERLIGPATQFAAGRGCYAREALPDWVTAPTDEQPTVDPWRTAEPDGAEPDPGEPTEDTSAQPTQRPPNRSVRFRGECGADRGYPPGWR